MLVIVLCSLDLLCLHESWLAFLSFVPKETQGQDRLNLINYVNVLAIKIEQMIV